MFKNTIVLLVPGLLILSACSSSDDGGSSSPRCTAIAYPNGVTITGEGVYEYRDDGNQAINGTPNPIRQAEILVLDSNGAIIQCGSTKDTGRFNVDVPQGTSNLSLRINSKIANDTSEIYVFNDPANRSLHYISKSFAPSADKDIGTLTATAATAGALKGGAFNILDKVYSANEYLITQTANCTTHLSACTPVTSIPAISIFWNKGVDPGQYINAGSPLSYYLNGASELYLLGGEDGDVNSSDTDHFDNTIIIHEYGHFIIDAFSSSDPPRGANANSHNGRSIIDPRLAFVEGWPDFFQAAVTTNPRYLDTSGTIEGTASQLVFRDLETPDLDVPTVAGEGNFREFSIARYLWDVIDTPNDGGAETTIAPFYEIWAVLTNSSTGLNADHRFRNIGLFSYLQDRMSGQSDWSSALNNEFQSATQNDYIRSTKSGSCSAVSITADDISATQIENGTIANSNMFASNDFYRLYHAGGSMTIRIDYTPNTEGDLDLYLFNELYQFNDTATYAASPSVTRKTMATDNTTGSETITASLAAGWYVINIRVYTGIRRFGSANYTMKLNGAALCPK